MYELDCRLPVACCKDDAALLTAGEVLDQTARLPLVNPHINVVGIIEH